MTWIVWFVLGIIVGWFTKIPFFFAAYNDIKNRQKRMEEISERITADMIELRKLRFRNKVTEIKSK